MANSEKGDFGGKVVIVTGSSSGIGAATAVEFARRGALLTITGRNAEALQQVANECKNVSSTKQKPLSIIANISDSKSIEKIFHDTIKTYGKLDVLVNNAGVAGQHGGIENQTLESFDEVISINLRAPFYLTKLAVPELEKSKGCIVNVSSAGSIMAVSYAPIYVTVKAALDHFTRCAAVDFGPRGIRVNAINPGYVPTNLVGREATQQEGFNQFIQNIIRMTPLRTTGTAENIAQVIAFLASEEAAFITGACLFADGGTSLATAGNTASE